MISSKVRLISFLGAFCFGFFSVQAQYSEILHPQTDQQIRLLKKNKVKLEYAILGREDDDTFFSTSFVDTAGHKLVIKGIKTTSWLRYDKDGRFEARLDSYFNKTSFQVNQIYVKYSSIGTISYLTSNYQLSSFEFIPNSRQLVESYSDNKKLHLTKIYQYSLAKNLVSEIHYDSARKPIFTRTVDYNSLGQVELDKTVELKSNYAQLITSTIYTYNSQGRVSTKNITIVDNYGDAEAEKNGFNYIPKTYSRSYAFEYDNYGQLVSESYTDKEAPNYNYVINRTYLKNGLLDLETYFNYKKQTDRKLYYRYDYYGIKAKASYPVKKGSSIPKKPKASNKRK